MIVIKEQVVMQRMFSWMGAFLILRCGVRESQSHTEYEPQGCGKTTDIT